MLISLVKFCVVIFWFAAAICFHACSNLVSAVFSLVSSQLSSF